MMHAHESKTSSECGVCKIPHFERNNYFHGKMLSARDLEAEQRYFNEKRWLINRTVLGWGIVCGLEVCLENGCLLVKPGLALDCCGHELLVCDRLALHANKIAEQLGVDDSQSQENPKQYGYSKSDEETISWALCLEYQDCKIEPVKPTTSCPSPCNQDDTKSEYNRIRDHYRLTIRRRDDACPKDHNDFCCPYEGLGRDTSIHQALVERSYKCPKCEECECVLLATGTLEPKRGQGFEIQLDEDYWKYRRVVYTNTALASLMQCFHGDLAQIKEINWAWKQGAHYDIDSFLDLLTRKHLRVTFDQPLREHTVKDPRSFRLSIYIPINEGGCPVHVLVPLERIEYYNNEAVYYFDENCIERQMRRCESFGKAVEVEIVLHGSMLLDKKGRALDAELIGDFPTGNGVQGGEFITYFTVGP